ncbi:GMP synthase [Klebsiella pneumoniae]|uniref:GMP synthase [glutamine-hydrolyzing] n=1 Tax=Klebsiella pneumoniae TaxID=573 RepID=A0A377WRI9_KLEPN|nr:GMP synthase [Klebsiella pneumoniae]
MILGLSGGVDSSVTAMLLHRAIGKNLTCVFVDNGLLRLNEAQQVMEMFGDHFGLNIVHVEGEQRFLDALAGESDPEAKRKIIGRVFVEVFDEEALSWTTSNGWRRVLSTLTLSSLPLPPPVKHTSSNLTTTWAACRKR